jgi:hypothetical protein
MIRYIRNVEYKVPFEFCKKCKKFVAYDYNYRCLRYEGCKEAIRLYKKYKKNGNDVEIGD